MTHSEAAQVVSAILASMRQNPAQFQFNVSVSNVGAVGIGGPGGAGIVGIAQGGGTGFSVSVSSPTNVQIEVAQRQAGTALNEQFATIQDLLEQVVAELRNASLTRAKADDFLASLKKTWLPNVVIAIISEVLKLALGG